MKKDICPVGGTRKQLVVWRDDRTKYQKDHEFPTVSTVITCAEDVTPVIVGDNVLVIGHVLHFHGKGFMPKFYQIGERWIGNGNVYPTYEEALVNGTVIMTALVKKQDEDLLYF